MIRPFAEGTTHTGHMAWRKQVGTDQKAFSLWVTFLAQEDVLENARAGDHWQFYPAVCGPVFCLSSGGFWVPLIHWLREDGAKFRRRVCNHHLPLGCQSNAVCQDWRGVPAQTSWIWVLSPEYWRGRRREVFRSLSVMACLGEGPPHGDLQWSCSLRRS